MTLKWTTVVHLEPLKTQGNFAALRAGPRDYPDELILRILRRVPPAKLTAMLRACETQWPGPTPRLLTMEDVAWAKRRNARLAAKAK